MIRMKILSGEAAQPLLPRMVFEIAVIMMHQSLGETMVITTNVGMVPRGWRVTGGSRLSMAHPVARLTLVRMVAELDRTISGRIQRWP